MSNPPTVVKLLCGSLTNSPLHASESLAGPQTSCHEYLRPIHAATYQNNHVWYAYLAAKSRKENDKFDRVNIVRNDNKSCLFGFNRSSDKSKAVLREDGFFRVAVS